MLFFLCVCICRAGVAVCVHRIRTSERGIKNLSAGTHKLRQLYTPRRLCCFKRAPQRRDTCRPVPSHTHSEIRPARTTYLMRSGRRSTTFGCVCLSEFVGDSATVQASINSVDSSTGYSGLFSSGVCKRGSKKRETVRRTERGIIKGNRSSKDQTTLRVLDIRLAKVSPAPGGTCRGMKRPPVSPRAIWCGYPNIDFRFLPPRGKKF